MRKPEMPTRSSRKRAPAMGGFSRGLITAALSLVLMTAPGGSAAQDVPVSFRNSVPIGSDGLCEAQIDSPQAGQGLFDRHYTLVCQDASAPVGELMVVPGLSQADLLANEASLGRNCTAVDNPAPTPGLPAMRKFSCSSDNGLQRIVMLGEANGSVFAASGVAVYEDALRIGLSTLATDRLVDGRVNIPLTQSADARAFARSQAEAISTEEALAEAYRRSNEGKFAEAAEFFIASAANADPASATEARLNAALQQSNLGNYLEAALSFVEIQDQLGSDPVLTRLSRNFEALDALNRASPAEALLLLDTPLPAGANNFDALREREVTQELADRLSAEFGSTLSSRSGKLTTLERVQLIDAQSKYIRATALRSQGNLAQVRSYLMQANEELVGVRDGRIISVLWLRAQILTQLGQLSEDEGDFAAAERQFVQGIDLLEANYPASPALVSARAELAGYYARHGRREEALNLYREMVSSIDSKPASALRRLLAPYFALLAQDSGNADAAEEMFTASQLLQRPGLAQTQAVLARELSGGSDEAAQLFRQTLNISRAIEQTRAQLSQVQLDAADGDGAASGNIAELEIKLASLRARQLELQQGLAQYPRYRVVNDNRMSLADLSGTLREGEAYFKLIALDHAVYGVFIRADNSKAWKIDARPAEIGRMVDLLRDSIALEQSGQTITYPFEIGLAHQLYSTLLGPVDGMLGDVEHLIFEPDGDMLRLPLNLLVMDDASVERYTAQADAPNGDPFDYRGTAWLGRAMRISTAVSPTAFRDVRATRVSDATNAYLGLGNNLPLGDSGFPINTGTRSGSGLSDRCEWSPAVWNNPILPTELQTAEGILQNSGQTGTVLTGAAFSDTGLMQMEGLDEYRILHFATHGLVTAPNPDCPPRPALLTSFGDQDSDGLLSFSEIFDLQLDADLIILSACNTASVGGLVANREAGISGTGDYALDGLVRAFVGAGGRTILASHWPVPDDFNATQRLISGLFEAGNGVSTTQALRQAQLGLMDDADTSHPFYWAAFAVVGDGSIPVRR